MKLYIKEFYKDTKGIFLEELSDFYWALYRVENGQNFYYIGNCVWDRNVSSRPWKFGGIVAANAYKKAIENDPYFLY